ncbi:hypothetical protein EBQ93_01240, partial [bacterium]|nr:hypothetical protein [bacterium]
MIKTYYVHLFFLLSFFTRIYADDTQKNVGDEQTRNFTFEDESRAFAGPQSSTNFASETLFSLSDFGRKTFHAYRSTNYRLTRLVNYQPLAAATPANEASSSPMIKVTASSVTIDLNGFVVSRQDTDVTGAQTCNAVGIEVGYSPYDKYNGRFGLTAGTAANDFVSVAQPEYVTIRNGTIDNFGIGIVVHAGVKNLTLENVTISNAALGIVFAGQSNKPITSVFLKNVRIVGDGTDRSAVLEWAKAKLEDSNGDVNTGQMMYGSAVYNAAAGATTLVLLQVDPVTAGTNLRIYSGVVMVHTNNANIEQVGCTGLGIDTAEEVTAPTATFGIYAQNCNGVQLTDVDLSNNTSQRLVAGLNCNQCNAVSLKNVLASNNHIATPAEEYLTPTSNFGLWASGAWLANCNNVHIDGLNVSKTVGALEIAGTGDEGAPTADERSTAMGLYLQSMRAAQIKNVQADYINSGITSAGYAYGVYVDTLESILFDGISTSYISGNASTDIANEDGSCVGMYFTGTGSNLTLKNVQASNNNASQPYSKVYGISFADTGSFSSLNFENVQANNNQNYGDAVGIYVGPVVSNFTFENIEANGMVAMYDGKARGIYFKNLTAYDLDSEQYLPGTTHHVTLKNVSCSNEVGIDRAEGIKFDGNIIDNVDEPDTLLTTIRSVMIDGLVANNNRASAIACYARGLYFDESLFLAADITVKNTQCSNHEAHYEVEYPEDPEFYSAYDAIGIDFGCPVEALVLENIVANNQRGDSDAYGIQFESPATVKSAVLKNIQVNNISKLSAAVDGVAAGISFGNTVDSIQILGGSASNNNGPDVAGSGKRAQVYGIVFEEYAQTGVISDWVSNRHVGFDEVAGIKFAGEVDSFTLRNVQANYNQNSNDSTYNTLTLYGLLFEDDAYEIIMQNVQASNNFSDGSAIGIHVDGTVYGGYLTDVQCNSNWSSYVSAFGCRFAQGLQGGSFKNFTANSNNAEYDSDSASPFVDQTTVVGLYIKNAQGVHFDTITCSSNTGSDILLDIDTSSTPGSWNMVQSAGVWLVNPTAITMKDVSCNYNTLHNTRRAAYTFGLLLDNPISVDIDGLSCSGNAGNAHVSGLFVNGGSSISLKNAVCSDNVQQGTHIGGTGETPRVYATVDTRVVTITPNGNISKYTVL